MFQETAIDNSVTDARASLAAGPAGAVLVLDLEVTDADVIAALSGHREGRARSEAALAALKIGVLALKQAQGQIDVERVRNEGDRLLGALSSALDRYREGLAGDIGRTLKEYFDPASGRFSERVERLIRKDGDLESVLRAQVEGDGSALVQTLSHHMGPDSAIMRAIDPTSELGLARNLSRAVEASATAQRDAILKEFSLDNPHGALARTVRELADRHGAAGEALEKKIETVVGEFSLDREDSALSRLVRRVDQAQRLISDEFSLDKDGSALARLRKEMLEQIENLSKGNRAFQGEVMARLTEMAARKAEALRSTVHGLEFEAALFRFVQDIVQRQGDIATSTGQTTGLIRNSKKGDVVIELGPEHAAAGALIVIEAKENASVTLDKAREELDEARKNRGAAIGLFVFSKRCAPAGLDPLLRIGADVFVIWDSENDSSDVVLRAGLALAKGLSTQVRAANDGVAADLEAIDRAIRGVEKQVKFLDEIATFGQTARSSGEKIEKRAQLMRAALELEVAALDTSLRHLKAGG